VPLVIFVAVRGASSHGAKMTNRPNDADFNDAVRAV
jgi:hypothetical protein